MEEDKSEERGGERRSVEEAKGRGGRAEKDGMSKEEKDKEGSQGVIKRGEKSEGENEGKRA